MGQGLNNVIWSEFKKSKVGMAAFFVICAMSFIGIYAPLFASSKPLLVLWEGSFYWPLVRYLFYAGFYTKPIDLFFNVLMFSLPLALIGCLVFYQRARRIYLTVIALIHLSFFTWLTCVGIKSPEHGGKLQDVSKPHIFYNSDPMLSPLPALKSWQEELKTLTPYQKLSQLLEYDHHKRQHERLAGPRARFLDRKQREMPTLWHVKERNQKQTIEELSLELQEKEMEYLKARDQLAELQDAYRPFSHSFIMAKTALERASSKSEVLHAEGKLNSIIQEAGEFRTPLAAARHVIAHYQKNQSELHYLKSKAKWLEEEVASLKVLVAPFIRSFHWEEDAGGAQEANQFLPWWELTRVNRKDLVASLLFGIRVSIVVGFLAVALSLIIGLPIGTLAGYFAGKTDLVVCRLIEMWEASPTFFVLLLVIAITQSKSIFLVIGVLGIFGWTGFARFIRSEVLKQRKLPYVEACHSLGYPHHKIMFSHILPNAIPPILTLLPFSVMAAITSEAALSFLGLGEEGATSWGVLMDEGRSVFPAESYLLWPPAILLTVLLIAIALAGDTLRDACDPKMRH